MSKLIVRLIFFGIIFSAINSANCDSDTENEDDFENDSPDHYFWVKNEKFESGKRKGESRWLVTLVIPPYIFKRKKERKNGYTHFSCNSCTSFGGKGNYATAQKFENTDGSIHYELKSWSEHHECSPSSTNHLVKQFLDDLYKEVKTDPTKAIPTIYEEIRRKISKNLDKDQKISFLQEIPSQRNICSGLYKYRRDFIPAAPNEYVSYQNHFYL